MVFYSLKIAPHRRFRLGFWVWIWLGSWGIFGISCGFPAFARVARGCLPELSARLGGVGQPPEPGVETAQTPFPPASLWRMPILPGMETHQKEARGKDTIIEVLQPPSPFMVSVIIWSSKHYCPAGYTPCIKRRQVSVLP